MAPSVCAPRVSGADMPVRGGRSARRIRAPAPTDPVRLRSVGSQRPAAARSPGRLSRAKRGGAWGRSSPCWCGADRCAPKRRAPVAPAAEGSGFRGVFFSHSTDGTWASLKVGRAGRAGRAPGHRMSSLDRTGLGVHECCSCSPSTCWRVGLSGGGWPAGETDIRIRIRPLANSQESFLFA